MLSKEWPHPAFAGNANVLPQAKSAIYRPRKEQLLYRTSGDVIVSLILFYFLKSWKNEEVWKVDKNVDRAGQKGEVILLQW